MKKKVYIQTGDDEIRTTIKLLEIVRPKIKDRVLIKPNLTMPASPESNICTSPKVVEGIVNYLRSRGIEDIVIGEGAGGARNMSEYFEITGYKELSKRLDVPLIDLNNDEAVKLKVKDGYFLKTIPVAKTALDRYIINVPKMKTHRLAIVTLALKNMMGAILPYNGKAVLHPAYNDINERRKLEHRAIFNEDEFKRAQDDFFKGLADFYSVLKPNLNIIDGFTGKDGDGLTHGEDIRMNCIIASDNVIAIDFVTSFLMGFDLSKLYLSYIKRNSLKNLNDIDIKTNVDIYQLRKEFKPTLLTDEIVE